MKVLVLSAMVPFIQDAAASLFGHLVTSLQSTSGVEAEGFRIPCTLNPAERLIDEMSIVSRLRLFNVDRLIALNFPAYLAPLDNKVLWLAHQHRPAYDLLDAGQSDIPDDVRGGQIIAAVRAADAAAFRNAKTIYTVAPIVSERLLHYNHVESSVLWPPLSDPELFTGGGSDGYILATGWVSRLDRQHLIIRALLHSPRTRVVIMGTDDTEKLRRLVVEAGVEDRAFLAPRALSRVDTAKLVNGCLAVACLACDESFLGDCVIEALQAGKAVVTVVNAGCVLDIVRDRETGIVVSPEPEALGAALAALTAAPEWAARLGGAGRLAMTEAIFPWPAAIEKLLA